MNFILVIYTVVAAMANGSGSKLAYDWRPIGEFQSAQSCEQAAMDMGYKKVDPTLFRCLNKR